MPADDDLPPSVGADPTPTTVAADRARRRRRRLLLGGALVAVGLVAAALAWLARDDDGQRPVGELIASDLPGQPSTTAPAQAGASTTAATDPTSTTALPATTEAATTTGPSDGKPNWPQQVRGRPPAFGGDGDAPPTGPVDLEDGAYLWNDFNGWHLWIVGAVGSDATIEVVSDDELAKADPVGGDPSLATEADRFTLGRGEDEAQVVGVDFNPGFYAKQLTVTVTGDLPLHLGSRGEPAPSPTVLDKAPGG